MSVGLAGGRAEQLLAATSDSYGTISYYHHFFFKKKPVFLSRFYSSDRRPSCTRVPRGRGRYSPLSDGRLPGWLFPCSYAGTEVQSLLYKGRKHVLHAGFSTPTATVLIGMQQQQHRTSRSVWYHSSPTAMRSKSEHDLYG